MLPPPAGLGNISKQFFLGGMFSTWSLTPLKVETYVMQTMEWASCPLGADRKLQTLLLNELLSYCMSWDKFVCRAILKSVGLYLHGFLLELKYMPQNCDSLGISHSMLKHSHLQLLLSKIQ